MKDSLEHDSDEKTPDKPRDIFKETRTVQAPEKTGLKPANMKLLWLVMRDEFPPYKWYFLGAIICMIVAASMTSATAALIDPAIKKIFIEKDVTVLYSIPLLIIGVSLLRGLSTYGQSQLMSFISINVIGKIQFRMYQKLLKMDLSYIHKTHSANIVASFMGDSAAMQEAATTVVVGGVKETLTLLGCVAVMFYQDWLMSLMTLFVFIPAIIIIKKLMKKTAISARQIFNTGATLAAQVAETVRGMRIVRVYCQEKHETFRMQDGFKQRLKYILKESRARSASSPVTEAVTGMGIAVAILYAGRQGIAGGMDINNFMSFFTAMMMAYQPARVLSGLATRLQAGTMAAERVYDFLQLPITIDDPKTPVSLPRCRGEFTFDNVCFAYEKDKQVLTDINLTIQAGEKVALVGASGGGKSTILNLIPRFYDVQKGRILLDGQDLKTLSLYDLRSQIALVSQDAFLFDGTIKENILYGNLNATDTQLEAALRSAAAYDFVLELPQGLHTMVGEAGILLSGGQKQRIAIARAFLKDAPILLLDEATSALDNESEAHVQKALQTLMQGRTSITIAHRLSTIENSDKIIVIHHGKIAGMGTHQQLLQENALYQNLARLAKKNADSHKE